MNEIRVVPLGAGQDVGRSCILVSIGNKNIMFDCGMHMGYNNEKRFPDFTYISKNQSLDEFLDCVIVSHFHLDHCGALPYFTEMVGYNGPIYMTHPTKAICPILLDDFRKITVDRRGDQNMFTQEMIHKCMKKVKTVYLQQVIEVDSELSIQPFYAGHVLGAAMFLIRVGKLSVLYTGDYNMTPDRHLGAAWVPRCEPNLLITESTYATTIRDSKRVREREFLDKIHTTLEKGGKILIPVFALGRAQELCILLENFWDTMNLSYPIYFSTGLAEKANEYYKLFISWTNQKIKETFVERNMFDFKYIKPLTQGMDIASGPPMVIFATPGMLHAGTSLNIFKKLAPNENNMVIIPGYCVAGTVGHKIQQGVKKLELDNKTTIDVRLKVEYLSFSAHADARGIVQLISQCRPRNVMLVHGEPQKMDFLKSHLEHEFSNLNPPLRCYKPANGEMITINCDDRLYCTTSREFLNEFLIKQQDNPKNQIHNDMGGQLKNGGGSAAFNIHGTKTPVKCGIVIKKGTGVMKLMDESSVLSEAGLSEHTLQFSSTIKFSSTYLLIDVLTQLVNLIKSIFNPESGYEIQCQDESFTVGTRNDALVTVLVKESSVSGSSASNGLYKDSSSSNASVLSQHTLLQSNGSSTCGNSTSSGSNGSKGHDRIQIFDVQKITDNQQNYHGHHPGLNETGSGQMVNVAGGGDSSMMISGGGGAPIRREICLHVSYSFQQDQLGSGIHQAIQQACQERRLDCIC